MPLNGSVTGRQMGLPFHFLFCPTPQSRRAFRLNKYLNHRQPTVNSKFHLLAGNNIYFETVLGL